MYGEDGVTSHRGGGEGDNEYDVLTGGRRG